MNTDQIIGFLAGITFCVFWASVAGWVLMRQERTPRAAPLTRAEREFLAVVKGVRRG